MRTKTGLLLVAVVVVFVGRVVSTHDIFNDVIDERFHIAAGLEYLQHERYTFEAQHPPLARVAVAALPYLLADLRLSPPYYDFRFKYDSYVWTVWEANDVDYYWKTLALARAGNLVFGVLLLLFVYRWSLELYGKRAALVACLLTSCCPSLLAHSGLATLDIAAAATVVMAAYFFWRWSRNPTWRYCLLSAVGTAAAVGSKFSAIGFLPLIFVLYFVVARWKSWCKTRTLNPSVLGRALGRGTAFLLLTATLVWAMYRFDLGPVTALDLVNASSSGVDATSILPSHLLAATVDSVVLPAPQFWRGIIEVLGHNESGHRAYLLGQFSSHGWWYYFPVALAVKSTIPMLLLFAMGIALCVWKTGPPSSRRAVFAVIPVVVVLGCAMLSNINIGIRHVLPIYPFLAILGSAVFATGNPVLRGRRFAIPLLLLAWHVGESVWAHPDYLPYFNEIARGREEEFLIDSNLDWGQDLARLGRTMKSRNIESIKCFYCGRSRAQKLGVNTWTVAPPDTDSGWIAVSVNTMAGLWSTNEPGYFAPLMKMKPIKVGKSIWLYHVESDVLNHFAARTEVEIEKLYPPKTRAEAGFNVQPGGESAIAIKGKGFQKYAQIFMNGWALRTRGGPELLSARVPRLFFEQEGTLLFTVQNLDGGVSNGLSFRVEPAGEDLKNIAPDSSGTAQRER